VQGLDPSYKNLRGKEFLTEAHVCCVSEYGLSAYEGLVEFISGITVAPPFPQLFYGRDVVLLCYEDSISTLAWGGAAWIETAVTPFDISQYNPATNVTTGPAAGTVPAGGVWHFADSGTRWFLTNGACVVFNHPDHGIFVDDSVFAKSCCVSRGRLYLGGLDNILSAAYKTKVQAYRTLSSDTLTFNKPNVAWVSAVDLQDAYWFNMLWFTQTEFLDVVERNEGAFFELPFAGDVVAVKPLGKGVVYYCEQGICYIDPVEQGYAIVELLKVGIADRGCVTGDELEHIFIDEKGHVWTLSKDLNLTKLDYSTYIAPLLAATPIMSFDPQTRNWYISTDAKCYLKTEFGLSEIPELVTSLVVDVGELQGIFADTTDAEFRFTTEILDFGTKQAKTLFYVQIVADDPTEFELKLYYRDKQDGVFSSLAWVAFSQGGIVDLVHSAIEFQIAVRATDGSGRSVEELNVYIGINDTFGLGGRL